MKAGRSPADRERFEQAVARLQAAADALNRVKDEATQDEQSRVQTNDRITALMRGHNPRLASSEITSELATLLTRQSHFNAWNVGAVNRLTASQEQLVSAVRTFGFAVLDVAAPEEPEARLVWETRPFALAPGNIETTSQMAIAAGKSLLARNFVAPPPKPPIDDLARFANMRSTDPLPPGGVFSR